MPRIRRERIPEALMAHLVRRIRQREIRRRNSVCLRAGWMLIRKRKFAFTAAAPTQKPRETD